MNTNPLISSSKNLFSATLICLVLVVSLAARAAAQTIISVNFQGSNTVALASGDITGASPFAAGNWNNLAGASGSSGGLVDSAGNVTSITTTFSAGPFGAEGPNTANSNPQQILFGGALNVNFGNASFTLSGLSAFGSYDIVAYYSGGTSFPGSRHASMTASGSSDIFYIAGINSVYSSYTQSNSTDSAIHAPGNYVLFSGLTGDTQTVSMVYGNNSMSLVGFQISGVPVPEPTSIGLILAGGLAILVRRRHIS